MGVGLSARMSCRSWHAELGRLYTGLPATPRRDLAAFVHAARDAAARLPEPLTRRLDALRAGADGHGYLLLTDLRAASRALPPTPTATPAPVDRPLIPMEGWLAVICARVGMPTAFRELRAGSLLQDIYPSPGAHPLSAESSDTPLVLHTEMAYHLQRPDFVLLACSRADHDGRAGTTVAAARAALPLLGPEDDRRLRGHPVLCRTDLAFRDADGSGPCARVRVLAGTPTDPELSYDRDLLEPQDRAARGALAALSAALDDVAVTVRLRPGDLLVLDNKRVVHGRAAFTPRWDGQDRWLHRMYARTRPQGPGACPAAPYEVVPFAPS